MKKLTLVLLLLLTSNAYAYETGDTYLGVQFGQADVEVDELDDIDNTYGLLRLGIYVTPALAIDLRIGDGIDDDRVMGVKYSIDRIAGLFALYHFELSSTMSIYGLLGYSEADLKARFNGDSIIDDKDDVAYGIGLDLGSFNIEYTQYLDGSDYELNAASIGYTYHFE